MYQKVFAAMLVLLLTFAFATTTFAQDTKIEAKKAEKAVLKSVSCNPACGFMVRSHDEKELVSIVKTHAKKAHKTDLTDKQIKDMMKSEDTK
jgi:predicted small metal-binding protein